MYKIILTPNACEDLEFWKKKDKKIFSKIGDLLKSIQISPVTGIGKPEHLRYKHGNIWSRRITREHRLIYLIENQSIHVLECRFHYQ